MQFIPAPVRKVVDFLTKNTDVVPTVERKGPRFVVTHQNERVRATLDFHLVRGHWIEKSSTLWIEGKKSNSLANTFDEYVLVFKGEAEPTGGSHMVMKQRHDTEHLVHFSTKPNCKSPVR